MKQVCILMVLLLFVGGLFSVNAQDLEEGHDENKQFTEDSIPRHWISAEVNFLGLGARYEYKINPRFSVGLYGHYHAMPFLYIYLTENYLFGVVGSLYPFAGTFFIDLGLGYTLNYGSSSVPGPSILPGFGWKIDFGKPGGLFFSPGIRFPFTIGEKLEVINGETRRETQTELDIVMFFGLGYAF